MGLPVLRARLLGPMDLRFGERQLPPLDSGRAESLLAWLDPADAQRMIAATRAFAAAVALKGTYDPANLFRLNQNIRPSSPAG